MSLAAPKDPQTATCLEALRQTRDSLIRASLVRHAALPGGALLAMLVAPKLLPFV